MTVDLSSPSPPTSNRRQFLLCGLDRAASLCALALAGCTFPVRSLRTSAPRVVTVDLNKFPELGQRGGMIKIRHTLLGAIYLQNMEGGEYLALSAICTHQGCVVAPAPGGFLCPCHGSTYDREGNNTGGPAPRPLVRFPVQREGAAIRVFLTRIEGR